MEITLEKIELVKDRTGVTYAEAKAALEEADGSVVDAIIAIEETVNAGEKKRGFGKKGEALFDSLKELVKKGNVAKIQVKRDDETIISGRCSCCIWIQMHYRSHQGRRNYNRCQRCCK